MNDARSLTELVKLFLKLGIIGFGGPAVHIAMMEEEVVRKRKWMSAGHFLDLVGATNLIPGPNSTEMAMHIGYERAGRRGLIAAGAAFIIPAVIITALIAWAYGGYGHLPEVAPFISGVKPAIIAVVAVTMINLGKTAVKTTVLGLIGLLAAVFVIGGANEIIVLFAAGIVGILIQLLRSRNIFGVFPMLQIATDPDVLRIFLIFLKVGAILYGSGYVLFAFLDAELVSRGLLTKQQLVDAIAVGQFTPGPVFSSATFIGWQMGGLGGAAAATVGIFLPSFLFVGLLNPLIPLLRRSKIMGAFLDAVNVASVGIIIAVLVEMARYSVTDWRTVVILIVGTVLTLLKVNTAFVVLAGGALGYLLLLL